MVIWHYDGRIHLYKFSTQNIITVSELDQHNSRINAIIPLYGGNYCSIAQESKIIIHDGDFNPIQILNNNDKLTYNILYHFGLLKYYNNFLSLSHAFHFYCNIFLFHLENK